MALAVVQTITPWLTNLIIAVMILLIGFMAGKLVGTILKKIFSEVQLNKAIYKFTERRFDLASSISSTISVVIYIVTFFFALDRLGIATLVILTIIFAALVIFVVAILLGLPGFLPNLYAGTIIKTKHIFSLGQKITIKTATGKISEIGFLRTYLVTKDDERITIPNYTLLKETKK